MSSDQTQHQSPEDLQKARQLSLEGAQPPAQVPGYKLQKFIGSGAFGEVWSATQLKTGRRVAIKFFTRRSTADIQMLAQEVEKLVALTADARYVVQLLDVGFDATPPYYVMDYIEGGSVEHLIKEGDSLTTAQAVDLFQEIATGMMSLHGKGILHCDLKPGNVLLDQDGKPRVADFGQSRLTEEQSPALGTLFYMAPEQADLSAIPDAGWDVYGLGAMLYCMLTGKPPYYSADLAREIESTEKIGVRLESYRKALLNAPTPTAHRQVAGVDRMLADLIDKCIAVNPKKRFSSVQSLLLALHEREMAQARRPLMLLGLIGPLLLMVVVSLFGWSAFSQAVAKTDQAVIAKARESNQFAAELAAQSAGEQIDEYFRAVAQLARDESFLKSFDQFLADPLLEQQRIQLADPNSNKNTKTGEEVDETVGQIRQSFKNNALRQKLQEPLVKRMLDVHQEYPSAASWFVCDRFGNQVASVFEDPENRTLANNYAFRSYFTGHSADLDQLELQLADDLETRLKQLQSRRMIGIDEDGKISQSVNLSAAFPSQQSNNWKVAFSAPIVRENQVQGIVAVTVDLGNLIELATRVINKQIEGEKTEPENKPATTNVQAQYVMLVDGRNQQNDGVILAHPLFKKVIGIEGRLSDELARTTVDIEKAVDIDSADKGNHFRDPVGLTVHGKNLQYGRDSIVSRSAVEVEKLVAKVDSQVPPIPETDSVSTNRVPTGLFVLAIQDYEIVMSDVRQLETALGRLGILALLMLIGVTLAMWIFVNRMMQESRDRMARAFSPSSDSSASLVREREKAVASITDSRFPTERKSQA